MPFFQPLDRASAIQWIQANPHSPVLRPCNFTAVHPHILAVTYMGENNLIYHSLVERSGGTFIHVLYNKSAVVRTQIYYESETEMEQALRSITYCEDDPSPPSSRRAEAPLTTGLTEDPC